MAYDLFAAIDDSYNFPPEVRAALAAAVELRNQAVPMTQTLRNNLSGAALWDGRLILNTTTDRINRYDGGTSSWQPVAELSEVTSGLAIERTVTGARNRIINGAFGINQRAAVSGALLNPGDFFADRWQATIAGSPSWVTDTQGAVITLPAGAQVAQTIEQYNLPPGRYVVSQAGTAKGRMYYIGGTAPAFVDCPFIVDVPNPSTFDLTVEFQADGGVAKTVSRVQVERIGSAGTTADFTPFERRLYGVEMRLCQRYYYRLNSDGANTAFIASGYVSAATSFQALFQFPETMRVPPTGLFSSGVHFMVTNAASAQVNSTAMAINIPSLLNTRIVASVAAGLTPGNGGFLMFKTPGVGWVGFNAEYGLGF